MTVTSEVCAKAAAVRFEHLSADTVAAARRLVLDGIAIAIAGTEEEAIQILAAHYLERGAAPRATAIGCGFKTDPVSAAALNGAAMHVLDFEPMWSPANHALSTTLAAVLAIAEDQGADGRDVVCALVKGVEMQGWIRQASGQFEAQTMKLHAPGTAGPFGAAVAAGHILGLDAGQLTHAIGLCASRAASVLANVGTMTKSTHCGQAAALGLEAAMLAKRGFTANTDTFGARQGYADTFHDAFKADELLNFGCAPWRIVAPGYAIKMFPSQFGTHFGITAALEIHGRIGKGARIRTTRLTTPVMTYVNRPSPKTGLDGKFSLQYTAGAALLDGKVGIRTFTDERLAAPDMQAMLGRFEVRQDPGMAGRFEDMHVILEVQLEDGTTHSARCDGPRGKWGGPPISAEEHLVKVRDCLATRLPAPAADDIIARAQTIDALDQRGLAELMQIAGLFKSR